MGSTITTGRVAAGIETQQGRKLFVLFEETYSSNVSPKTPSWCCVGLGYLPATMERIFDLASSCEGGMLRNRSGRLTPEGYIGTWLKELANPLILRHTDLRVQAGKGLYDAIPTARLDEAVDLLTRAERPSQANELHDTGIVTLDLERDTNAVLTLQAGLGVSPWRLIERHAVSQRHGTRNRALGHWPQPGRVTEHSRQRNIHHARPTRQLGPRQNPTTPPLLGRRTFHRRDRPPHGHVQECRRRQSPPAALAR